MMRKKESFYSFVSEQKFWPLFTRNCVDVTGKIDKFLWPLPLDKYVRSTEAPASRYFVEFMTEIGQEAVS